MFGGKRFTRGGAPQGGPHGQREHHEHEGPSGPQRLVVPGEMLVAEVKPIPFSFVDGDKTYSSIMGVFDEGSHKFIPLEGCYMPNLDDVVIGVVTSVRFSGYSLDIKSPYVGFLSSKDTRDVYKLGDVLAARVKDVDEVKNVDLTESAKLEKGEIIEIPSVKIPRVIGKNSSMIKMIQEATKSEVVVGKNGRVWIKGGDSSLAVEAILQIEREAHTHGLTNRISALLKVEPPKPFVREHGDAVQPVIEESSETKPADQPAETQQ